MANVDSAEARLDKFAGDIVSERANDMGYPMNQSSELRGFYRWFSGSGLNLTMVNNCGDPFDVGGHHLKLNTIDFEREVIERFDPLYLNCSMPMINCSRSAMTPLKFWWILQHTSAEDFTEQTAKFLENARWLKDELDKMNWPAWLEPMSNTVYFKRPSESVAKKYDLAPDFDERLGGELAHIVVMQHVTKERLRVFLDDLREEILR